MNRFIIVYERPFAKPDKAQRAFLLCRPFCIAPSRRALAAYNGRGDEMKKILFKSMSTALSAADVLKSHGIISRPVRGGNKKCGCCVELYIDRGGFSEVERILDAHAFVYEVSDLT